MRKMPSISDYFVITGATSTTHANAIADSIKKKLRDAGVRLWHSEGERESLWILLDYGGAVAHVFLEETRRFYDLERLWSDAPQRHFKEIKRRRNTVHATKRRKGKGARPNKQKPKNAVA